MVAIDMCEKSPITGEWIYEITRKHAYVNISVLFIIYTTSILKFVFPTAYCFCLGGCLGGCLVVIVVAVVAVASIYLFACLFCFLVYLFIYLFVYLFIYLFIYSVASTNVLVFVVVAVIAGAAFVAGVNVAF